MIAGKDVAGLIGYGLSKSVGNAFEDLRRHGERGMVKNKRVGPWVDPLVVVRIVEFRIERGRGRHHAARGTPDSRDPKGVDTEFVRMRPDPSHRRFAI